MAALVALGLGLLSLAFVLYPLARSNKTVQEPTGPTAPEAENGVLDESERAARMALQEVELDFQLGNLAEEDYRVLRERYMRRALVALKSRHDREQELDELIEEQLRKMKESDDGPQHK